MRVYAGMVKCGDTREYEYMSDVGSVEFIPGRVVPAVELVDGRWCGVQIKEIKKVIVHAGSRIIITYIGRVCEPPSEDDELESDVEE
jgi:hypothetical protein